MTIYNYFYRLWWRTSSCEYKAFRFRSQSINVVKNRNYDACFPCTSVFRTNFIATVIDAHFVILIFQHIHIFNDYIFRFHGGEYWNLNVSSPHIIMRNKLFFIFRAGQKYESSLRINAEMLKKEIELQKQAHCYVNMCFSGVFLQELIYEIHLNFSKTNYINLFPYTKIGCWVLNLNKHQDLRKKWIPKPWEPFKICWYFSHIFIFKVQDLYVIRSNCTLRTLDILEWNIPRSIGLIDPLHSSNFTSLPVSMQLGRNRNSREVVFGYMFWTVISSFKGVYLDRTKSD